jgi:hypothetical protein
MLLGKRMDESFFQKLLHAEVMFDIDSRSEFWRGCIRGLERAFYGDALGTEAEHEAWLLLRDSDDEQDRERGRGYRHGLGGGGNET